MDPQRPVVIMWRPGDMIYAFQKDERGGGWIERCTGKLERFMSGLGHAIVNRPSWR